MSERTPTPMKTSKHGTRVSAKRRAAPDPDAPISLRPVDAAAQPFTKDDVIALQEQIEDYRAAIGLPRSATHEDAVHAIEDLDRRANDVPRVEDAERVVLRDRQPSGLVPWVCTTLATESPGEHFLPGFVEELEDELETLAMALQHQVDSEGAGDLESLANAARAMARRCGLARVIHARVVVADADAQKGAVA